MANIQAKKIPLPAFAREPNVSVDESESVDAFKPHLDEIFKHLHSELERAFNDPEIFFLNEADGFPLRTHVTGEYYVSDTTYECEDEENFVLSVHLNCLCNEAEARGDSRDYVSMETFVYLSTSPLSIEYEPGYQSASI